MDDLSPDITELSHAHHLELILRTTLSGLAEHAPHIRDGRSLRVLGLALQSTVADLEDLIGPWRSARAHTANLRDRS